MKNSYLIIILPVILLACRGAENKADQSTSPPPPRVKDSIVPVKPATPATGQTRKTPATIDPATILAQIDQHVKSSSSFDNNSGNMIVTLTNTLPDASFQKLLVGVSVVQPDGTRIGTTYYTVVNLDAGMSKVIKIPNTTSGSTITAKIAKVKSVELTKGEFVLVDTPN